MSWKITFIDKKAEEETLSFPDGILADFLHIAEMAEAYGPTIGEPFIKPMRDVLYEIQARGDEGIGSSLFCTMNGKEIVILHSSIKTTHDRPVHAEENGRRRGETWF